MSAPSFTVEQGPGYQMMQLLIQQIQNDPTLTAEQKESMVSDVRGGYEAFTSSAGSRVSKELRKTAAKAERAGTQVTEEEFLAATEKGMARQLDVTNQAINGTRRCFNPSCTKNSAGVGSLKKCARCQTAMYCGPDCQRAHWPTHKQVCKIPAEDSKKQS